MQAIARPTQKAPNAWGDQAAGLRHLMARRLPPGAASLPLNLPSGPALPVSLWAQDPALGAWLREHMLLVNLQAATENLDAFELAGPTDLTDSPDSPELAKPTGFMLLAVRAQPAALPQSLTWAYARLKRMAQQDAAQPQGHRLLPRVHLVLVGIAHATQAQHALANMTAAVQRHLGAAMPPGAWLCSSPEAGAEQDRTSLALDFCRLAAELRQWPAP